MKQRQQHWTERSIEDFAHRLTFDFVTQVAQAIETMNSSQARLADRLGVSEGRVSQVLNSPSPMSLRNVVRYARAIDKKVALVLYDDDDPENSGGPVNSEVFARSWEMAGKPSDLMELEESASTTGDDVPVAFYITIDTGDSWHDTDAYVDGFQYLELGSALPKAMSATKYLVQ